MTRAQRRLVAFVVATEACAVGPGWITERGGFRWATLEACVAHGLLAPVYADCGFLLGYRATARRAVTS